MAPQAKCKRLEDYCPAPSTVGDPKYWLTSKPVYLWYCSVKSWLNLKTFLDLSPVVIVNSCPSQWSSGLVSTNLM